MWGGEGQGGTILDNGELYEPVSQRFTAVTAASLPQAPVRRPQLEASLPEDSASAVPLDSRIALRFSQLLQVETVNLGTVTLSGPTGRVATTVTPVADGLLAFLIPQARLLPETPYTVTIDGPVDGDGLALPRAIVTFTTAPADTRTSSSGVTTSQLSSAQPASSPPLSSHDATRASSPDPGTEENDMQWHGAWRDGTPYSPWQDLPPLQAEAGGTALAGQVLDLKGEPLANVTLAIKGYGAQQVTAQTDATGRFLLTHISSGWAELLMDGRLARSRNGPPPMPNHPWGYGVFEYGLEIRKRETNVLSFTIWLPKIDTAHAVTIPSPTTAEVVVTTPFIRYLELHIPAGTVLRDHDGQVVTQLSITPIPVDRPPFPLPAHVEVPIYFTIQPGGAYVANPSGVGARLIYPNYTHQLPGTRFTFWHYAPDYAGWYVYGLGTVTADGTQVVPDPGVSIHALTGAMVASPGLAPPEGPPPCDPQYECCSNRDGDPIDLTTGLMLEEQTDLTLRDVLPVTFTRTYRPRDTFSRAFGLGASHAYDWFVVGTTFPYTYVDVVLPTGGRVHYDRISPGTSFADAVYEHVATSTRFYKSQITWNGTGWVLTLRDGTVYVFDEGFGATRPGQAGLIRITDRHGNTLSVARDTNGNVTQITSPNGRWLHVTSDTSNRITQIQDTIGRTVSYTYDASGRLGQVTDANGGVTTYTYDTLHRILTKQDPRGNTVYTNEYDSTGKVIRQTLADGGLYQFAYTTDANGKITQVDVTDPRGIVRRVVKHASGYLLSDTRALGRPEQQTTTFARQAGTNLVLSMPDPLGRQTAYTYDAMGNVTSRTRLAGTPQAVTTTWTYEPTFNQVASRTDPLGHTTTLAYDAPGNLIRVTDPLGQQTTLTYNAAGQPLTVTDPMGHTTQLAYDVGDLATVTDPLGNTLTRFTDSAGRVLSLTTPLGQVTRYDYDAVNRLLQMTDPLGGVTAWAYDATSNLLRVTDARGSVTTSTYDSMNRVVSRTDPLLRAESAQYDVGGNLTQVTDRTGQVTSASYDGLNRRTQAAYADGSTIMYTYDAGDRLTQLVDSLAGTITRTYDGLDWLLAETTPQGTVSYSYDLAGRRTSMTVTGQPTGTYTYGLAVQKGNGLSCPSQILGRPNIIITRAQS